jgi:hypothetical protein
MEYLVGKSKPLSTGANFGGAYFHNANSEQSREAARPMPIAFSAKLSAVRAPTCRIESRPQGGSSFSEPHRRNPAGTPGLATA